MLKRKTPSCIFFGIQPGVLPHTGNLSFIHTYIIKVSKLQKYVFQHFKLREKKLISIRFLRLKNSKKISPRKMESNDSKLPRVRKTP